MQSISKSLLLAGLISTWLCSAKAGEASASMKLVREGKPLADIVVARDAGPLVKKAAETLRTYLKKSTGADFSINDAPQGEASIHVGMTPEVAKSTVGHGGLDHDGFILQGFDGKGFVILGGSDYGTEYGVYDFLERYLGIKWLMPTEVGEDVPKHSNLEVSTARVVSNPVFLLRYFSPLNPEVQSPNDPYPRYTDWARRNRINRPDGRLSYHHQLLQLLPPSKYGKTHPEFYPYIDPQNIPEDFVNKEAQFRDTFGGKHYIPSSDSDYRWNPNFSAPGIVDAAAEEIITYFREHPEATSYSLAMNDSNNFDQSSGSLSRRSGKKNYLSREDISDDYFLWANAVVEKVLAVYPDKWFGVLAYNELADPPTKVPVHPRIIPFLTYERLYWIDPELKAHNQGIQARWENATETLGWYDYIYGLMYMLPRIHPHQTQEALQWGVNHKVRYYTAELFPNWGEGPKAWIQARLLWDPNVDVDALMKDWCESAVGRKAAPMLLSYYEIWEKYWTKDIVGTDFWNKSFGRDKKTRQYLSFNDFRYLKEISVETIQKCDGLMEGMLAAAETPEQKVRAEKLHAMWQFYKWSYYAYPGLVLGDTLDFQKPGDVLSGLEKASFLITATGKRKAILDSFENDPLFHDVWMRVNNVSKRGGAISGGAGDVRWGFDLISKAKPLAQTNEAVRQKLTALTNDPDETVRNLAKAALK